MSNTKYMISIPWGEWDHETKTWYPNPHLRATPEEQYEAVIANGTLTSDYKVDTFTVKMSFWNQFREKQLELF